METTWSCLSFNGLVLEGIKSILPFKAHLHLNLVTDNYKIAIVKKRDPDNYKVALLVYGIREENWMLAGITGRFPKQTCGTVSWPNSEQRYLIRIQLSPVVPSWNDQKILWCPKIVLFLLHSESEATINRNSSMVFEMETNLNWAKSVSRIKTHVWYRNIYCLCPLILRHAS